MWLKLNWMKRGMLLQKEFYPIRVHYIILFFSNESLKCFQCQTYKLSNSDASLKQIGSYFCNLLISLHSYSHAKILGHSDGLQIWIFTMFCSFMMHLWNIYRLIKEYLVKMEVAQKQEWAFRNYFKSLPILYSQNEYKENYLT